MKTENNAIICQTPNAEMLMQPVLRTCSEPNCNASFRNDGNFYLHMLKHHRINIRSAQTAITHFFCPEVKCKYNAQINSQTKFFLSMNLLRQHYYKVHAEKTIECKICHKLFSNETLKTIHERSCGQEFKCIDCTWTYSSREALLTHCKRKMHRMQEKCKISQNIHHTLTAHHKPQHQQSVKRKFIKIAPKMITTPNARSRESKTTQTIAKLTKLVDAGQATKATNSNEFLDTWNSRFKGTTAVGASQTHNIDSFDMESTNPMTNDSTCQTDKNLNKINYPYAEDDSLNDFASEFCHIETQTEFKSIFKENITPSGSNNDPMLYTHMHTQTSDDILSELGLTDIQTQTNWTSSGDVSEMFVSTETQTSFSSRFLENTSTYTQTICEDQRTFRDLENSSSSSSQSAYTQTVFENCLVGFK